MRLLSLATALLLALVLLPLVGCQSAEDRRLERLEVVVEGLELDLTRQESEVQRHVRTLDAAGWPGASRAQHAKVVDGFADVRALLGRSRETGDGALFERAGDRYLKLMRDVDELGYQAMEAELADATQG